MIERVWTSHEILIGTIFKKKTKMRCELNKVEPYHVDDKIFDL